MSNFTSSGWIKKQPTWTKFTPLLHLMFICHLTGLSSSEDKLFVSINESLWVCETLWLNIGNTGAHKNKCTQWVPVHTNMSHIITSVSNASIHTHPHTHQNFTHGHTKNMHFIQSIWEHCRLWLNIHTHVKICATVWCAQKHTIVSHKSAHLQHALQLDTHLSQG